MSPPRVGQLDSARILFVSSNPSIGDDNHAVGASPDDALWDSHHLAFGGGTRSFILDGIYTTAPTGEKLKKVAYWVAVRARARELIRNAVPGRDYALTEVVHCKSKDEVGVASASEECSGRIWSPYCRSRLRRLSSPSAIPPDNGFRVRSAGRFRRSKCGRSAVSRATSPICRTPPVSSGARGLSLDFIRVSCLGCGRLRTDERDAHRTSGGRCPLETRRVFGASFT